MEREQQFTIRTASRAKIPRKLSYPVGAESISAALASVPQVVDIRLHFYWGIPSVVQLRSGHYEFLRIEYLNDVRPSEAWPISSLYKRPDPGRWDVVVQAVPRTLRHRIRQYVLHSALTQIAHWLNQRKAQTQRGHDILAFFYDQKTDDFVLRNLTRLEPLR